MTEKERMFCEFMCGEGGAVPKDSIYYKIIHTPDDLLEELETKNKEECEIFHRYSYENGYWDGLVEEYNKGRLLNG